MMRTRMKISNIAVMLAVAATLVSCGTKRAVVADSSVAETAVTKQVFLQKVRDAAVESKNITSKIEFALRTGEKEISVSGSLRMRKDDVIRIQLTPFGLMEVGRLEFTKDYVLIMDRVNKQYVKAGYGDLDFLRDNGLDFYALQSLFWNELFQPGEKTLSVAAMEKYGVDVRDMLSDVTYDKGKMKYRWTVDSKTGIINTLNVEYGDKGAGEATVNCDYSAFKAVGKKQFPTVMSMRFAAKDGGTMHNAGFNLRLKGIGTDGDWESRTEVGSKYKEVTVETLMNLLMSL